MHDRRRPESRRRHLAAPLLLTPLLVPKPWGGRRLERLGRKLPAGERIGESWEVADLGQPTSTTAEPVTRVRSEPLAGYSLADIIDLEREALLGDAADLDGRFPLMFKLLDAREHLSVQVHPPAAYAATDPGAVEKTETWVILDADPGAEVLIGVADGVSLGDLKETAGTPAIARLLRRTPAVVGDIHHLPAGTVHALGGGVLVAEVQTPSDSTYRLYDWTAEYDRAPRGLHVDAALRSMELAWGNNVTPVRRPAGNLSAVVEAPEYRLVRHLLPAGQDLRPAGGSARIVQVVEGRTSVTGLGRPLGRGDVVVLPAAWSGRFRGLGDVMMLEVAPRRRTGDASEAR